MVQHIHAAATEALESLVVPVIRRALPEVTAMMTLHRQLPA